MEEGTYMHAPREEDGQDPAELTTAEPAVQEQAGENAAADEYPAPDEYSDADDLEPANNEKASGDGVFERLRETVQDIVTETAWDLEAALKRQLQSISHEMQSNHEELLKQIQDLNGHRSHQSDHVSHIPSNPSTGYVNLMSSIQSASASKSELAKSLDRMHTDELIRWNVYCRSDRYGSENPRLDGKMRNLDSRSPKHLDSRSPKHLRPLMEKSSSDPKGDDMLDENASLEGSSRLGVAMSRVLPGVVLEESQPHTTRRTNSLSRSLRAPLELNIVTNMSHNPPGGIWPKIPCHVDVPKIRLMLHFWSWWGVIPLNSRSFAVWYQRSIMMFLACASVLSAVLLIQEKECVYENIAQVSISVCTLLCLACFKQASSLVGPSESVLLDHASVHGYLPEWRVGGLIRFTVMMSFWLLTIILSMMGLGFSSKHMAWTVFLVRAIRNGVLFAFIHCMWQILSCLRLMVDSYCVEFWEDMSCEQCVATWNALQALLRRTAEAVENSFLALQIATTAALVCGAIRAVEITLRLNSSGLAMGEIGKSILLHSELLLLVMSSLVIFASAASVTEKCFRVPPLVNSALLEPDKHIDEKRQYLVTFITNSHAGFYVKGTRFTFAMLARFCYLYGTVMCGLASAVLSTARKG